jgi:hypothetical protein
MSFLILTKSFLILKNRVFRIALLESRLQAQVLLNSSAAAAAQDANPEQEN